MPEISAKDVKALRDRTGAGMMDCKKALTDADGDVDKAIELLRVKQGKRIEDRGERVASEGTVQTYVHHNAKIGVIVEVDCETDFVAKNDDFVSFAREVASHIAAAAPRWVSQEEVPARGRARPSCGSSSRRPPTSRRRSAPRSRRASSRSGTARSCCSTSPTSTPTSTTARRSASSAAPGRGDDRRERRDPAFLAVRRRGVGAADEQAGLQAGPAQALGRGADGPARVRHRPRAGGRDRDRCARRRRVGRPARDRSGRRQHLPRPARRRRGHGPRDRRLHGDAGDRAERAGAPGRLREAGRAHPRAVGDHSPGGRRALHPPPRDAPPREGARRDLRGGHRQPVLHDRHGGCAARERDPRRGDPDGQERRRGRLQRRSGARPGRRVHPADHAHGGDPAPPRGDGRDRADALHGEPPADPRLQRRRPRQHRARCSPARRSERSSRRPRRERARTRSARGRRVILLPRWPPFPCNGSDRRPDRGCARAHAQVGRGDRARARIRPHRPREPVAARPHPGRLLRGTDAATPDRDDLGPRGAPADDPAVRRLHDQGDREGDQRRQTSA